MKMPSKTELALRTKEELIDELLGLSDEKEKLKKKLAASGGNVTEELVNALKSLANKGNEAPIDVTPQGYAVLPPIPINSMLPIQKVKWRIDNVTAILDQGGLKPDIDHELRRKIFVWQKKFVELYEAMKKEAPEIIKEDKKLAPTPDPDGKSVTFHLQEYYDANVVEFTKKLQAKQKQDAQAYNMPVKRHVYK